MTETVRKQKAFKKNEVNKIQANLEKRKEI